MIRNGSRLCVLLALGTFSGIIAVLSIPFVFAEPPVFEPENMNYVKIPETVPKPWVVPDTLELQAVDEEGTPVGSATVEVKIYDIGENRMPMNSKEEDLLHAETLETDEHGIAVISFKDHKKEYLGTINVKVVKDQTHVPAEFSWRDYPQRSEKTVDIPDRLEVVLPRGEMLTCRVVDEDGQPVEGVEVVANIKRGYLFKSGFSGYLSTTVCRETTDSEGRWTLGPVALGDGMEQVNDVRLEHPDYMTSYNHRYRDTPVFEQTFTILRGNTIRGRVCDTEGKPLDNVSILRDGYNVGKTDQNGEYLLKGLRDDRMALIASAPGMTVEYRMVDPTNTEEPMNFTLSPGKTIRIRAIKEDGSPMKEIRVSPILSGVRGYPFISTLSVNVDENGVWEWNEAPDREIRFTVYSTINPQRPVRTMRGNRIGYFSEQPFYEFTPDEETHIITMKWVDEINGRTGIWDIPDRMVVRVVASDDGRPLANRSVQIGFAVGTFLVDNRIDQIFQTDEHGLVGLDFSDIDRTHAMFFGVAVKGNGIYDDYEKRWSADPIRGNERSGPPIPERMTVVMVAKEGCSGIVIDEDGCPLEGVEVTLGYYTQSTNIRSDRSNMPFASVKTNADGAWNFSEFPEAAGAKHKMQYTFSLPGYVTHVRDSRNSVAWERDPGHLVTLYRGKVVSGRVLDENDKPIAGTKVYVNHVNGKRSEKPFVETDAEGRFRHVVATDYNRNEVTLTAQNEGKISSRLDVDLTKGSEHIELRLLPAKALRIRFVRDDGGEIPGVTVHVMRLSGQYEHTLETNNEGLILWQDVPDIDMDFMIWSPEGFRIQEGRNHKLRPREEEYRFHLVPTP